MAHELEIRDGRASFFSVKESAWHQEGEVLLTAPDLDTALQIGRLDYPVEKRPTQFACTTPDGDTYYKPSTSAFVTVRADTQQELGSVGKDYVPVQNVDAFRVLEPLLDAGVASLETGGVIRNGADAWLLMRWNMAQLGSKTQDIFADEIRAFGLVANNHNGRRGILLQDTNIRVVCANTLGFAERSGENRLVVKHSSQGLDKLIEAAQTLWHGVIARYDRLSEQYALLRQTIMTTEQFEAAVLDVVAPDPLQNPQFNPIAPMAQYVLDRARRKRAEVTRLWAEGLGHTGDPTAWYAYNAAVEAIDHNRELFPTRAGSWRTGALLDGQLKKMKDTVLANCLAVAA